MVSMHIGPAQAHESDSQPAGAGNAQHVTQSDQATPSLPDSPIVRAQPGASAVFLDQDHPAATAWHYGDPLAEQARVDNGLRVGLGDFWDQACIAVRGEERHTWLNSLISQKVNAITPGTQTYGLVLDAQGHVEHFFHILATEDALLLHLPAAEAGQLVQYLQRMVFWAQVDIALLDVAALTLVARDSQRLATVDLDGVPGLHHPVAREVGGLAAVDLWVARESFLDAWLQLRDLADVAPVGRMAFDAWRVQQRIPSLAVDLDGSTIPHEVGFFIGAGIEGATTREVVDEGPNEAAVHLNKGCYRGQETVSRVHNLGKAPRMLVLLHADGSGGEQLHPGASITAGGRAVGRVGSVAQDADYGPIALALLKRNVVEKLASNPSEVPPLIAGGVDVAVDALDIARAGTVRQAPGREAIQKLRNGAEPTA